jgi:Tol biopolymer transport system component
VRLCFSICFILIHFGLSAQGLYQNFGQNTTGQRKIAYSVHQDNVEIIYYQGGEELAKLALEKVVRLIPEFETRLNYNISNGIKITVFNHYEDFKNSNINITNPQYYAGGYSQLTDNAASVYFDGSRINFEKQLRKAVSEILINEFIYGGNIRERIQTAALLTLPNWYYKGLVEYLAESWNIQNDNFLKDFFQSKKQRYFTSLQREDEILAGHSIWRYLEEKYGKGAVSNIVFLTKVGKSVENAVIYYTGMNMNMLLSDWQDFYLDKYRSDELVFKFPKGQENAPFKLAKKQHTQFKLSQDGSKVAIVTNTLGRYQVVIYSFVSKEVEVICSGGHMLLNRDINLNYPLIAWNPDGKHLSVVLFKNDHPVLYDYDFKGALKRSVVLKGIPFVKDFCYRPDGKELAFSALRNGQSDIVLYNLQSHTSQYINNDIFDNFSPRYDAEGRYLYFISNKDHDGKESNYYAIYRYDSKDNTVEYIIGEQEEKINCMEPIPMQNGNISYLSDRNGIINNFVYSIKEEKSYQLTNYKRCIIHNDVSTNESVVADLLYFNNRYRIYVGVITEDYVNDAIVNAANTSYRKWIELELSPYSDTGIKKVKIDTLSSEMLKDTMPKKRIFLSGFELKDELPDPSKSIISKGTPFITIAKKQFGIDYLLQQLDNSILNNYLFPTNLNEKVFNYPFLSPHIQTSISDDRKDHVIVAGVRIPFVKIKASDYYLTYTNRAGRWDKEFSAFRRARVFEYSIVPTKMLTTQGKLAFRYPFTERARIELNGFSRNDRIVRQAVDSVELLRKPIENLYFGNGFEYIFDNVRSNGLNLFQGLRIRVYNENYWRTRDGKWMLNSGVDARYYKKLHRQIYMAVRLSGAISTGSIKTVYYMGGVENWLSNIDSISRTFNYNNPTYSGADYTDFGFQTITAPARGFLRNSRAGNKYALMNVELRIPLLSYLIQKPISSEFFKSFMVTGFVDLGTAWKGKSPYSIDNPFNTVIVQSQQYYVTVQSQRDPMLYGMGFGLRAKIIGHYIKYDRAWGLFESQFLRPMNTFSIGLDF